MQNHMKIELTKESSLYTTFITPFGRYAYKRLPFGISSAPEVFQAAIEKVIGHLDGVVIHVDDTLVIGKDQKEHDRNLQTLLTAITVQNFQQESQLMLLRTV